MRKNSTTALITTKLKPLIFFGTASLILVTGCTHIPGFQSQKPVPVQTLIEQSNFNQPHIRRPQMDGYLVTSSSWQHWSVSWPYYKEEARKREEARKQATEQEKATRETAKRQEADPDGFVMPSYMPALWPVKCDTRHVISGFGTSRGSRSHAGLDIKADRGVDVVATADGVVTFSGTRSGYGQIVIVDHGSGFKTAYAHLDARCVEEGCKVEAGQKLGDLGATGRVTTHHVHYEVRIDGKTADPLAFIPAEGGIEIAENALTEYGEHAEEDHDEDNWDFLNNTESGMLDVAQNP